MIENQDFDINCDYASLCLFLPSWKLNARKRQSWRHDSSIRLWYVLTLTSLSSWTSSQFKLSQCWSKITRNPQNISLFHFNVFCLWQECRFFNSWNAFCLQSGENGFIDVLAEGENHASLINNNIDNIVGWYILHTTFWISPSRTILVAMAAGYPTVLAMAV